MTKLPKPQRPKWQFTLISILKFRSQWLLDPNPTLFTIRQIHLKHCKMTILTPTA
ncbi:hypothetical protein Hanom_Chr10g00960961 [Helianthus anomalus]